MILASELILSLVLFAFVTSYTPGPTNILLLTSGVNFGMRRSLRLLAGMSFGFLLMLTIAGFGLGEIFKSYPEIYIVMKWLSVIYFIYLAWGVLKDSAPYVLHKRSSEPLGFFGAIAFQIVNPKVAVMTIGYFSSYAPSQGSAAAIGAMIAIFYFVHLPSLFIWLLFGDKLSAYLQADRKRRLFNGLMALLLILSLVPILFFKT